MSDKLLNVFPPLELAPEIKAYAEDIIIESLLFDKSNSKVCLIASGREEIEKSEALCASIKEQIFKIDEMRVTLSLQNPAERSQSAPEPQNGGGGEGQKSSPVIQALGDKICRSKFSAKSEDMIFGKKFEGEVMKIKDIEGPLNNVVLEGHIFAKDVIPYTKKSGGNGRIISMKITDYTDSIGFKLFIDEADEEALMARFKENNDNVRICGHINYDNFEKALAMVRVVGICKAENEVSEGGNRMDNSTEKRVELHCHTKLSTMDGLIDPADLVKRAMKWGHKSIAITDHGVVQGFPPAFHAVPEDSDFKIIYGMEAYLVDDTEPAVINADGRSLDDSFVVFDLETTGLSAEKETIIEIGAVKITGGNIVDTFSTFVNPEKDIPYHITELTTITNSMVADAPVLKDILPKFIDFCGDCVMVAHNANFDMSFIENKCRDLGIKKDFTIMDTVLLSAYLVEGLKNYKLDTVAKALNVPLETHHRAVDDATCTANIFLSLLGLMKNRGIEKLDEIDSYFETVEDAKMANIKRLRPNHCILLAKNDTGRVNLYTLVSKSHIQYFHKKPRIPKSELLQHKEGLIIGSACSAGQLYDAILLGKSEDYINRIAEFYDYLEIQPTSNNNYLIASDRYSVNSVEDLQEINRKIYELGQKLGKPVVATTDAHFMDPEDEIYRHILLAGQKFKDADDELPIYLRTTEEMLQEFSYLGEDIAREVVITNTNKIADMVEKIDPVRPDKCPPVLPNSEENLSKLCHETAEGIYGSPLPEIVKQRLDKELNSIISNGYSVMYIIAHDLVKDSMDHGYLVGSRGSVGSSFAATMSGITEVNPLPPHYYCKKCHYSDFESETVKNCQGTGFDLPHKNCPVCGEPLTRDGFNIPFETFLGFKGDKEPDIDLNFSGEYQAKAHKYTEVLFGEGNTFKAGTISALAEKTAYGYVRGYFEERGIQKRFCELDRLSKRLVGIRKSTGQHPGGIVVLPKGENINSFTPVQRPANDVTSDIVTTHFDYHSIDHNLLKLDILGHDDPTMIRRLEDLTGYDSKQIQMDCPEVMALFVGTESLKVSPEAINCPLGVLGIPEFGTNFVIQMLLDTKPKLFSDLIKISGLSHGTDVWTNNAQTLINENVTDLNGAICTRDDIMLYLKDQRGMDPSLSFNIMEKVRKGKGLTKEWEEAMAEADVPQWYIDSCNKIQYMFPKAHAAAYVMMAFRIAYYKVFYPLAYYAAFFSIRAKTFDYEKMALGQAPLKQHIKEMSQIQKPSATEKSTLKDMAIVNEMYARGFEFMPIDIYRAKAKDFQIIDGKIMPSLNKIEGLGDTVAIAIEEESQKGKYTSIENFRQRTKADGTVTEKLQRLGILEQMPQSEQLSIFDF